MLVSLWLLVSNYCVIISECQKVTFWGVESNNICQKIGKKIKLLEIAWKGEEIDQKCFLKKIQSFFYYNSHESQQRGKSHFDAF